MRIKCPNCGSSAQIELTYMDHRSYDTQKTDEYICGCGCHFEVTFEATEVRIIKEENYKKGLTNPFYCAIM